MTIRSMQRGAVNLLLSLAVAGAFAQGFDDGWNSGGCLIGNGESADFTREFKAYRTYTIMASGTDGAVDVDLEIRDSLGRVITEDTRVDRDAVVSFRPSFSGRYTIRLKLAQGIGRPLCHFVVFVDRGGWDIPLDTFARVLAKLTAALIVFDGNLERFYGYIMEPTEHISMDISGLRGSYFAVAVGSDNASDLDLVVRRVGLVIAKDELDDAYPVCEFENFFGGQVSVEVSYFSGKGPALVLVGIAKRNSGGVGIRRL